MDPRTKKIKTLEVALYVAIVGTLIVLFMRPTLRIFTKSRETVILENLGIIRSALALYYTNNQRFPTDDLACLTADAQYLEGIPTLKTHYTHSHSNHVIASTVIKDFGRWYYDNDPRSPAWGSIHIGCTHKDSKRTVWSTY